MDCPLPIKALQQMHTPRKTVVLINHTHTITIYNPSLFTRMFYPLSLVSIRLFSSKSNLPSTISKIISQVLLQMIIPATIGQVTPNDIQKSVLSEKSNSISTISSSIVRIIFLNANNEIKTRPLGPSALYRKQPNSVKLCCPANYVRLERNYYV